MYRGIILSFVNWDYNTPIIGIPMNQPVFMESKNRLFFRGSKDEEISRNPGASPKLHSPTVTNSIPGPLEMDWKMRCVFPLEIFLPISRGISCSSFEGVFFEILTFEI